jgi:hypothetical protein
MSENLAAILVTQEQQKQQPEEEQRNIRKTQTSRELRKFKRCASRKRLVLTGGEVGMQQQKRIPGNMGRIRGRLGFLPSWTPTPPARFLSDRDVGMDWDYGRIS